MIDGELEIEVDGVTTVARPGSFVLAPSGLPHAFRVMSDTARVLSISSAPSGNTNGGFPHFLQEVGEPAKALALPVPQAPDPAVLDRFGSDARPRDPSPAGPVKLLLTVAHPDDESIRLRLGARARERPRRRVGGGMHDTRRARRDGRARRR